MIMIASQEFWEDDLEVPATDFSLQFQNSNIRESWLNSLSGRQLNVILKHHFNHQHQLFESNTYYDGRSVKERRTILSSSFDHLSNYYLVSRFSYAKLDSAVIEVAISVLSEDLIESFLLSNKKYDKKSILFTLFNIHPNLLKHVLLFNKVQRKSFSSFTLKNPPRQKSIPFKDFLSEEVLQKALKLYDLSKNDSFESKFKGFFYHQNRIYLSIRRANDADIILNSNKIIHGYKPDCIILDFALNGNQVNLSTKDCLEIANSIVSQYFERECSFIDVHNQNEVAKVHVWFGLCVRNLVPNINMVELRFISSEPSTYLTLTTGNIEELLQKIEPVVGSVLHNVSLIQHVKLIFQNKKVTLSFQPNTQDSNYIAINYSEHVLNRREREDFKLLFKDTYGLTILSKTKSSYLQANSY